MQIWKRICSLLGRVLVFIGVGTFFYSSLLMLSSSFPQWPDMSRHIDQNENCKCSLKMKIGNMEHM